MARSQPGLWWIVKIRALGLNELPLCLPFGEAFTVEKQLPDKFDPDVFLKTWTGYLTQYPAVIFGLWDGARLVGGIGGMVFPDSNTGVKAAIEFFWYVDPVYRNTLGAARLPLRFKAWGKQHDAKRLRMIHLLMPGETPSTVKLAGFYGSLGMRPIEVAFDGPIE